MIITRLLSVVALIVIFAPTLIAQIPNSSFENWTGGMPDGWCTENPDYEQYVTQVVGNSGFGVRMAHDTLWGYYFWTCPLRFPLAERFQQLRFFYRCHSLESPPHQSSLLIMFNTYDSDNNLMGGVHIPVDMGDNTDIWTEAVVLVNYYPNSPPIASGAFSFDISGYAPGGAWFEIDDIELVGTVDITDPQDDELWIAGEIDTIKWTDGDPNMSVKLEYSDDNGNSYNYIDVVTPASIGEYEWDVPADILSREMRIRISNFATGAILGLSDRFKVKPYIITRTENDDYIAYDIDTDRWGFGNYPSDMWPVWWWLRFNYRVNLDPFTGLQYSQTQGGGIFRYTPTSIFPDWISVVNTFTAAECYWSTTQGIYKMSPLAYWDAFYNNWHGSCFGIAISNALAFENKAQFTSHYPDFPVFDHPISVLSDTDVIPVMSELFTHQFGEPHRTVIADKRDTKKPNETLNELKDMLSEDNVAIKILIIFNNSGSGAHGIIPYKVERDPTDPTIYHIWVWDNSHSNNVNAVIAIDTTGNDNMGIWSTQYGWGTWGGDEGLILSDVASSYLSNPTFPTVAGPDQPVILTDSTLEVHTTLYANVSINDSIGNTTGYIDSTLYYEIPSSTPLILINGAETPPYGYVIPNDDYSVTMTNFQADTIDAYFLLDNKSYSYRRSSAQQDHTDRLYFESGLATSNPDQQSKSVGLLNIVKEESHEKLFLLESLDLIQNDSVKIENVDNDNNLKLSSYGSAKVYEIRLEYASETEFELFNNSNVPLPENTSHTLVPEWDNVSTNLLTVLVDYTNDGTIDDTLFLENQTTEIYDQGSIPLPGKYTLSQNYPNPFNATTTIKYELPKPSSVTIEIYDIMGRKIETFDMGHKPPGYHEIVWDANDRSAGVYFYKLTAGEFVDSKKMVLLK